MLPVTCVLTRESAMVEHEVQIWNTGALNCMTFPYDLIKCSYKAVSPVTFASVDSLGFLGDLQPLPQPPRGCKEAHKRVRGRRGSLTPSLVFAVAHDDGGVRAQSRSDLMEERKWLMRSGSPLGDAGLPSSKARRSSPPWATSPDSFTICAPLTLSLRPPPLLLLNSWDAHWNAHHERAQNVLLHFILKGGIRRGKKVEIVS